MFKTSDQLGQSLIEVLVAAFILGLLAIALAGIAVVGTKTALVSEQRTVAQAVANEKIELIKITPYLDVGFNDGSVPDGVFPPTDTISQNDQDYVVSLTVELIDDPENGCLDSSGLCDGSNITEATADYKRVVVSVKYPSADVVTKEVKVSAITVTGQAASLLNLVGCDPTDPTGVCGAGQLCCSQQCLPKCEAGTCPEGYRCAGDGCGCELDVVPWQSVAECFNDFECLAANEQCVEGACVALCAGDSDCPAQESCIYGLCEVSCSVNDECSKDKECVDGSCQSGACLDNTYCSVGYKCIDFQCKPIPCTADNECPSLHQCIENTCMPNPCSENSCPGDWSCVAGLCQPVQCTANQACNSTSCVQERCQPVICTNHEQCEGDAVCLAGVCSDPPPCPCGGTLECAAGECVNPSRDIVPLTLNNDCLAPVTLPCLPAIGEVTVTWVSEETQDYCTPIITSSECTTAFNALSSWSDTDGDGDTNCGVPSGPIINECTPFYPIECGTSFGGALCPVGESCLEGRCFPDAPCPIGYAVHPTVAGACVKEWGLQPPIVCPAVCPGAAYCSSGECVTVGCQTDEQCSPYGDYMCRNLICVPKKDTDCSYCIPPERIQYCYGLDCVTCDGGAGTACTDSLGGSSVVVWYEDEATGCSSLVCGYAPTVCGDGIVQPGEDCEPPGGVGICPDGSDCTAGCACPAPVCGNNAVEGIEECDGSDDALCPGLCGAGVGSCLCPETTPEPACGNGLIESGMGEECDPVAVPDGCQVDEYCESDCWCYPSGGSGTPPPPTCDDGTIDPGEQCDPSAVPDGCAPGDICEYDCVCYAETPIP